MSLFYVSPRCLSGVLKVGCSRCLTCHCRFIHWDSLDVCRGITPDARGRQWGWWPLDQWLWAAIWPEHSCRKRTKHTKQTRWRSKCKEHCGLQCFLSWFILHHFTIFYVLTTLHLMLPSCKCILSISRQQNIRGSSHFTKTYWVS